MGKKKTPAINSSSTADIAFLLLCYFLMTTTMGSQLGLSRRLPPIPDKNQEIEDQKINRRNIIVVRINSSDRILAGSEGIEVSQLKDKVKEFLTNPNNDPKLPEKEMKEIEGFGQCAVSKGVISLQNDRGTSYDMYFRVQNELAAAINELRDELAREKFHMGYADINDEQRAAIDTAIPVSISEAEPTKIGEKK